MLVKKVEIWEDGSRKRHKVQIWMEKKENIVEAREEREPAKKKEGTTKNKNFSLVSLFTHMSRFHQIKRWRMWGKNWSRDLIPRELFGDSCNE